MSNRFVVFKALECLGYASFHGDVNVAFFVVPLEVDAATLLCFPVFRYWIVFFERVSEVTGVIV